MNTIFRKILLAGALAFSIAASFAPQSAEAAFVRVCAADRAGAALGPRQITAPSGTSYSLDGRGCTLAANADALGLQSMLGFSIDPGVAFVTAASTSTAFSPMRVPAGAYLDSITVQEVSGGGIVGGLKFGTAAGGTQIATWGLGTLIGASYNHVPDVSMLKRAFSSTAPTDIHFDAVGNWSGAAVNITIHYSYF
ncbi:MAG: hypothetical protein ABIO35_08260 [Nitrobacter sp.]